MEYFLNQNQCKIPMNSNKKSKLCMKTGYSLSYLPHDHLSPGSNKTWLTKIGSWPVGCSWQTWFCAGHKDQYGGSDQGIRLIVLPVWCPPWESYLLPRSLVSETQTRPVLLTFVSYVSGMKALGIFPRKCQKFACHSFRDLRKPVDHRSGFTAWNPVSNARSRAPPRLIISDSQRMRPRNLNLKQMAQVPSMHMRDEVADSKPGPWLEGPKLSPGCHLVFLWLWKCWLMSLSCSFTVWKWQLGEYCPHGVLVSDRVMHVT